MEKGKRLERRTSKRTDASLERMALDDYTTFPLGSFFFEMLQPKPRALYPQARRYYLRFSWALIFHLKKTKQSKTQVLSSFTIMT